MYITSNLSKNKSPISRNLQGFFEILLGSEIFQDDSLSYTISLGGNESKNCLIDISSFSNEELANLKIPLQEELCADLVIRNYPDSISQWSCTEPDRNWIPLDIKNQGFYTALNPFCILELDSFLTLSQLNISYDQISNDSIKIDLGQLTVRDLDRLYFYLIADCNAPKDKPLCMKLTVFPNQECFNSSNDRYFMEICAPIENFSKTHSLQRGELKIYPNPSTNQINFNFQTPISKSLQFRLYNSAGQKLLFREVKDNFSIEKSEVGAGIFFFEMRESGAVVERGKLIFL